MQYEEITFQGSRSEVDELLTTLNSIEEVINVELKSVTGKAGDFLGREPLNQTELADIIIGITVNLISSAIYDQIRKKIDDMARKKGFTRKSHRNGNQ